MNKIIYRVLLLVAAVVLTSCSKDGEAPVIDSVWKNMVSEPIEPTIYAYPGQTICLHGQGFSDLRKIFVNGTDVDFSNSLIYDTDNYITFQLPKDVATTSGDQNYIRVITARGEDVVRPFIVKPTAVQPTITSFSSTTLVAGRTLTITGTNLDGATEVMLPLAFEKQAKCQITGNPTATSISVIIPEGVSFASGKCVITMDKTYAGQNYTEHVYSKTTIFVN